MQLVSTERGRDPRDYALLPFGGAGPLLAAEIAEELAIDEILVPPNPGVISALGLLSADYIKFAGVTRRAPSGRRRPRLVRDDLRAFPAPLPKRNSLALGLTGALGLTLTAEMRFVGQAFEIPVDIDPGRLQHLQASDLADRFDADAPPRLPARRRAWPARRDRRPALRRPPSPGATAGVS